MALSTWKKALIVLSTVVIGAAALTGVYFLVPTVKEKVNDTVENLINKIKDKTNGDSNTNDKNDDAANDNKNDNQNDNKNDDKNDDKNDNSDNNQTDDKEQQKTEEKKDQIQNDERLENFDDDKKGEIVDKFEKITDSDDYKNMSDKEKDELVDKLIESEVIQEQIKVEQIEQETRQEEVKSELGGMSEELGNVFESEDLSRTEQVAQVAEAIGNKKSELEETINSSTASPEEVASAQEQLDQLNALEQEYVANQTTSSIAENLMNNQVFQSMHENMVLNKINGIYLYNSVITIDAEFVQTETISGIEIYSQINAFARCAIPVDFDETYDYDYTQLINYLNEKSDICDLLFSYINNNEEENKDYFEKNKLTKFSGITKYEDLGYEATYAGSLGMEESSYPVYFVQIQHKFSPSNVWYNLYQYNDKSNIYRSHGKIEKICPEFWAQKEIEESKQSAEAQASADEKYIKREDGKVTGFDYVAFQQDQANKAQETKTSQDTYTPLYADFDLGRSL